MTTSRHFPTFHAVLRACASPRCRALVRALTSPRRVWFWTTTLPVLAAVALFVIMQPEVRFDHSGTLGGIKVSVEKHEHMWGVQDLTARIQWRGGCVETRFEVFFGGRGVIPRESTTHEFGPLGWESQSGWTIFGIDAHWLRLRAIFRH